MDIVITEIEDAGVSLKLVKLDSGRIEIKYDIASSFLSKFGMNWLNISLSKEEFIKFQECLEDGIESRHGNFRLSRTTQLHIKKQNHPNNYRNIRFYRRMFFIGYHLASTTLSQKIVNAIIEVKV